MISQIFLTLMLMDEWCIASVYTCERPTGFAQGEVRNWKTFFVYHCCLFFVVVFFSELFFPESIAFEEPFNYSLKVNRYCQLPMDVRKSEFNQLKKILSCLPEHTTEASSSCVQSDGRVWMQLVSTSSLPLQRNLLNQMGPTPGPNQAS